jgi:hypothetical protein
MLEPREHSAFACETPPRGDIERSRAEEFHSRATFVHAVAPPGEPNLSAAAESHQSLEAPSADLDSGEIAGRGLVGIARRDLSQRVLFEEADALSSSVGRDQPEELRSNARILFGESSEDRAPLFLAGVQVVAERFHRRGASAYVFIVRVS